MDWSELRSAGASWLECEDTQGAHDLSHWAMDFIPERPNDPADAEWLENRGGWLREPGSPVSYNHELEMAFETYENGTRIRRFGPGDGFINPTRMTVALFEAAAMEAMKHG